MIGPSFKPLNMSNNMVYSFKGKVHGCDSDVFRGHPEEAGFSAFGANLKG